MKREGWGKSVCIFLSIGMPQIFLHILKKCPKYQKLGKHSGRKSCLPKSLCCRKRMGRGSADLCGRSVTLLLFLQWCWSWLCSAEIMCRKGRGGPLPKLLGGVRISLSLQIFSCWAIRKEADIVQASKAARKAIAEISDRALNSTKPMFCLHWLDPISAEQRKRPSGTRSGNFVLI